VRAGDPVQAAPLAACATTGEASAAGPSRPGPALSGLTAAVKWGSVARAEKACRMRGPGLPLRSVLPVEMPGAMKAHAHPRRVGVVCDGSTDTPKAHARHPAASPIHFRTAAIARHSRASTAQEPTGSVSVEVSGGRAAMGSAFGQEGAKIFFVVGEHFEAAL
jgi:hypothetical protein